MLAIRLEVVSLCGLFAKSILELKLPGHHRAKIILEMLSKGQRLSDMFEKPSELLSVLFQEGM